MRWVWYFILLLMFSSLVDAAIQCPQTAIVDTPFDVLVSVPGASQVGIDIKDNEGAPEIWNSSSEYAFSITNNLVDPSLAIREYLDLRSGWEAGDLCLVDVQAPQDSPGTGTVNAMTTSTTIGRQFWVEIYPAHDDDGINRLVLCQRTRYAEVVGDTQSPARRGPDTEVTWRTCVNSGFELDRNTGLGLTRFTVTRHLLSAARRASE